MTAAELTHQFLRHRRVTEQLCAVMPEAQYGFRPYEGAMSFGQLAVHLVLAAEWFLGFGEGQPFAWPSEAELPQAPGAIREFLAQASVRQTERIERLSGEPDRMIEFRGRKVPVWALLASLVEHEAHHKGQMMLLARMCGVQEKLFYTKD